MAPNPEFHNAKRAAEDKAFVNMAFSGDHDANPAPTAITDSTPSHTATSVEPPPGSTTIVNRRNSAGNSKSQAQQEGNNHSNDTNNNTGRNDNKGIIACTGDDAQLMDFDDLLPHIGEFGRYQKMLFLLMIPFATFVAWTYFSQIFLTLVPQEFHCALPELDSLLPGSPERFVYFHLFDRETNLLVFLNLNYSSDWAEASGLTILFYNE